MFREHDKEIWEKARVYLDVRNNDEHTLVAYQIARKLLEYYPEANAEVVLPAILLHDTGWKKVPQDKLMSSFGINKKYPELLIQHEKEGAALATEILKSLGYSASVGDPVSQIIDGHDSTLDARHIEDAVVKDADKLWRFSPHGNRVICNWYNVSPCEAIDIVKGNSMRHLLLPKSKEFAGLLVMLTEAGENLQQYL